MRCLLVEDEPGIREGLAALLRKKGHEVHTAADCAGARAALAGGADYDVVVTDWRLPDGLAVEFLDAWSGPAITVSGHPEEVERCAAIREVLTKPVTPSRLLASMAAVTAVGAGGSGGAGDAGGAVAARGDTPSLLPDVHAVVDPFVASLPPGAVVELHDDGTFVVVVVTMSEPPDAALAAGIGAGDLRCRRLGDHWRLELRLCRDGRPDPGLRTWAPSSTWPATGEFAVDFAGSGLTSDEFFACLERARRVARTGGRVHFLNVPNSLRESATSHGRAHDMPMRAPVGPRVREHFADLWS